MTVRTAAITVGPRASEVQTLHISGTPTGGSFKLTFTTPAGVSEETDSIAFDATAGAVETALEALSTLGPADVSTAGGTLPGADVTITFAGTLALMEVPLIRATTKALTGGSAPDVSVSTTTPGGGTPLAVSGGDGCVAHIVNSGATVVYVGGEDVTSTNGLNLRQNVTEKYELAGGDNLYAVTASGTQSVVVLLTNA